MSYVDGFLLAVPTDKKQAYHDMAAVAADIFMENGAVNVVEAWGDEIPDGKTTDFKMAVKATPEETVVFSWVMWPSKEARDEGMKKFMADERLHQFTDMPFDGQRMIFGGFRPLLERR